MKAVNLQEHKQSQTEIALDIIAFASLCVKCGFEDSVANNQLFVEMVNEAGFRTPRGDKFTYMGFRQMMRRLPDEVKRKAVEEMHGNDISFDYITDEEARDTL